jgi:hypothetical protein
VLSCSDNGEFIQNSDENGPQRQDVPDCQEKETFAFFFFFGGKVSQWVRSQVALGCLYLWHTGAVLGHDFVRPKAILGLK